MERLLENFGAYRKSRELFELVVRDMAGLAKHPPCARMVTQQVSSADSICANIEEGYGRGSRREYAQFLVIARGSAQETRGRYDRMSRWLPAEASKDGIALSDEIIAILSAAIKKLRTTQ